MSAIFSELVEGLELDLRRTCYLVDQLSGRGDITSFTEDIWQTIASDWINLLEDDCRSFLTAFTHKFPGSAFESIAIRPLWSDGEYDNFVELRISAAFDDIERLPSPSRSERHPDSLHTVPPQGLTFTFGIARPFLPEEGSPRDAVTYVAIDLAGLEAHDRFIAFAKFHENIILNTFSDLAVNCQHSVGTSDVRFSDTDAIEYLKQYTSSTELATWPADHAGSDIGFTLTHFLDVTDPTAATIGAVRMMSFFDIVSHYFEGQRDRQKTYF